MIRIKIIEIILVMSSTSLAANLYLEQPLEVAFLQASLMLVGGFIGKWAADLKFYFKEKKAEREFEERMLKRSVHLAEVVAKASEDGICGDEFLKRMQDKLKES